MRDLDIRRALHDELTLAYGSDPDTLIVDELGLCQGDARVDVAVVNGVLTGYEIKSPADTLARLPRQAVVYGRTLDRVIVIAGENHLPEIAKLIPEWWGLRAAVERDGRVMFEDRRDPGENPDVDPLALVQLIWRDEALEALNERGLGRGLQSKPRRVLWQRLVAELSLQELKDLIRQTIRVRERWRSGARPS